MTWALFLGAVVLIFAGGVRLARAADVLAETSGLGRALLGTILVAAVTSLPELVTGLTSAGVHGLPDIAAGDVFGSCVFNLLLVALLDLARPGLAARAHPSNLVSLGFAMALLAVAGIGIALGAQGPRIAWVGLPSVVLVALYLASVRCAWNDARHGANEAARAGPPGSRGRRALVSFAVAAVVVVGAGSALPIFAARIAEETGLGQVFVGGVLVGAATSLPEVAVTLAALRLGAIDLALGNLLGSNLFNMFILALDDAAYTPGPLLGAIEPTHLISLFTALLMNAVLLLALARRQERRSCSPSALALALVGLAVLHPFLLAAARGALRSVTP